jgi:hypothetical protein
MIWTFWFPYSVLDVDEVFGIECLYNWLQNLHIVL